MKLRLTLLAATPLVFCHCGPSARSSNPGLPTEPASSPGLPAGHKPYEGPHRGTYALGMEHGRTDGTSGKSRQPSRHYGNFPATQTDAFNRGYQAGYSLATRPGTVTPAGPAAAAMATPNAPRAVTAPTATGPLKPFRSPGKVTLRQQGQIVSICHTAMPEVELARFIDGQRQIAVKSRANHGPATLQLFDTMSGEELARVMAHQVQGGWPSWAIGLGE